MTRRYLFTSESVTEGHPDKMSDQISDAVLDAVLEQDPKSRVACETLTNTGLVLLAGEITTKAQVDYAKIARQVVKDIGYTKAEYGIGYDTASVLVALDEQSPDISQGVTKDSDDKVGAGDQGIMFGYATNETPELMPLPIQLAHRLGLRLSEVRHKGIVPHLRPDAKSQVTVAYEDGKAVHADGIVIAQQHDEEIETDALRKELTAQVIEPVIQEYVDSGHLSENFLNSETNFYINHTGRFVRGGPYADAGLTGRKIIVDTYGGAAPHGGGAFSGKDPTKVDRSAAYGSRWAAKNVVAAGIAERCQIQLGYSIGHHEPVSINVETFGTAGKFTNEDVEGFIKKTFDFSPGAILKDLDLRRPIYRQTAAYGHFGRHDIDLPWEQTNRVDELKKAAGL